MRRRDQAAVSSSGCAVVVVPVPDAGGPWIVALMREPPSVAVSP